MRQVYFIKPIDLDGPIKIGCSARPSSRARSLEGWSPFPLEVVATIEGDLVLEGRFHRAFLAYHSHGEWFHHNELLAAVIDDVRCGKFDVETLPPYCGTIKTLYALGENATPLDEEFQLARRRFNDLPWQFILQHGGRPDGTNAPKGMSAKRKGELIDRFNRVLSAYAEQAA